MRASLQDVTKVIKSSGMPARITQEPFDHDPGHYQRLGRLQGASPDNSDLEDYASDMQYMELQPDLLRHLTPVLLTAWKRDLFEGGAAGYRGFVENFWPALLKGEALQKIFTEPERVAFINFIRETILDRIDAEDSLRFSGMGASPYRWVQSIVCYGVLFPNIEDLWNEWWQAKTSGHAVAVFQYASALMYEEKKNPVFAPWTPDKGGGAPALWHCGGPLFGIGWKEENLLFLKRILSVDYFNEHLRLALDKIHNLPARKTATRIVDDLPGQETILGLRIEELPKLLADMSAIEGFTF